MLSVKDVVSVIFSIIVIIFIAGFCTADLIAAKRMQDKARRDRDKEKKKSGR